MNQALRTIAVGFDGSASAEIAVRWSFTLARRVDADVVIVHAVGLLERMEHANAPDRFLEPVHRLANEVGFERSRLRWHVTDGDACSVLLRAQDEPIEADLLVVGSRGQGVHTGLLLGSTSLQLAERATIPFVIVPSGRD
jgi:nucleotide-binding universal stress UspA family protein